VAVASVVHHGDRPPLRSARFACRARHRHRNCAGRSAFGKKRWVAAIALDAPAHVALEADGAVDSLSGLTPSALARIAGIAVTERSA
jgi:hypothetical protein